MGQERSRILRAESLVGESWAACRDAPESNSVLAGRLASRPRMAKPLDKRNLMLLPPFADILGARELQTLAVLVRRTHVHPIRPWTRGNEGRGRSHGVRASLEYRSGPQLRW